MQDGIIRLMNIRSCSQLADLLTKALNLNQFTTLIVKMGILNIHSSGVHLEGECQNSKKKQCDGSGQKLDQKSEEKQCNGSEQKSELEHSG